MKTRFVARCALAFLAIGGVASADVTVPTVLDVTLSDVSIEADGADSYRLKFKIANDSASDVVLTGLSSPDAAHGELVYYSSHGSSEPLEELILLPDEEADFSTSHFRARLIGFSPGGDLAPFTLVFRRGEVSGEAHVH